MHVLENPRKIHSVNGDKVPPMGGSPDESRSGDPRPEHWSGVEKALEGGLREKRLGIAPLSR